MSEQNIFKYTVGFVFSKELDRVLLVHKERPEWMAGMVNGVGGKLEAGETASACMRRETREETALEISEQEWIPLGTIRQSKGDVRVFTAVYSGNSKDARKNHHEEIGWFDVTRLPGNVVSNLRWLIPLALDRLQSDDPFSECNVVYA